MLDASLVDRTEMITNLLCPAFPHSTFASALQPELIQQMLEAELQTQIPVAAAHLSYYTHVYPGLCCSSKREVAFDLVHTIAYGLSLPLQSRQAIDLYCMPFWQALGLCCQS